MNHLKKYRSYICLALVAVMAFLSGCGNGESAPSPTPSSQDFSAEIAAIEEGLAGYTDLAAIISGCIVSANDIALCFESLGEEATVYAVLDILDLYDIKATFFMTAVYASEMSDLVREILLRGHHIGSNGLTGETGLDQLSVSKQVGNIYKSVKIIEKYVPTGGADMLKLNDCLITENIQKITFASGAEYIVEPDVYLNYSSFKTEAQTKNYAKKIIGGNIVSIKLEGQLSEGEFAAVDSGERPAYDPPPSITDEIIVPQGTETPLYDDDPDPNRPTPSSSPTATPAPVSTPIPTEESAATHSPDESESLEGMTSQNKIVKIVGWLAEQLSAEGYNFVTPAELHQKNDASVYEGLIAFDELSDDDYEYIKQMRTTLPAVALTFDRLGTDEQVNAALDKLRELGIKASFFVSGRDANVRNELVSAIVNDGHFIYTTGISGSSLSSKDAYDALDEIVLGKAAVESISRVNTRFFRPPGAVVTDDVRVACASAGMVFIGYSKNPVGAYDAENDTIEDVLKHGVQRGDIITMQLDQEKAPIGDFIQKAYDVVTDTGYRFTSLDELYDNQYPVYTAENIENFDTVSINLDYDKKEKLSGFVLDKIDTKGEKVAFITFDDWGSDKTITKILNTLDEYDVKISFFIIGDRAKDNPNLLKAIEEAGHDIANHTNTHIVGLNMEPQEAQEDLIACYTNLALAIGRVPELYFRPPGLNEKAADPRAIKAAGYKYWLNSNVSTADYVRDAKEVLEFVEDNFSNGDMIIMHISDNSSGQDAIGPMIEYFWAKGYKTAKISDYLEDGE